MYDLAIINGQVFLDSSFHKTNVYIRDGIIAHISPLQLRSNDIYDASQKLVIPGIIDPHTHFQLNLGRISSRDDFLYGTKAGAYGGVTTIIDFLEPVDNPDDLELEFEKRVLQAKRSVVDYKFHACLKDPKGAVKDISKKMKKLGLNTVKIFTTYSESNRRTYDDEIIELLEESKTSDFLVTAHIEDDGQINIPNYYTYRDLPKSRPTSSETDEALKLAEYVRQTGGNLYMVHCSSGETLTALKRQYNDILNKQFFVESCPHYFLFNEDKLNEKDGYLYTMAPPLRHENERLMLKQNIDSIYTIGTDHCSFNKRDKDYKFLKDIPLGIGGIEYSFPIMYTMFGNKIIDKMTKNVALVHKLYPQKGVIQEGSDADLFIYEPNELNINKNHGFTDHSLYKGYPVNGEVISTISRGKFIIKNGSFTNRKGQLLNKAGE